MNPPTPHYPDDAPDAEQPTAALIEKARRVIEDAARLRERTKQLLSRFERTVRLSRSLRERCPSGVK